MSTEKSREIPISKVKRASKMMSTGLKVGGNYLKYYASKALNQNPSKEDLDENNARDIYESLSQLKGSALKAAQMISMDHNFLPPAYAKKFRNAQYKAPPLSYPLVKRTFMKSLGKAPEKIFDTFTKSAINAASIGQVHQATLENRKFAVKVQYPGVADSVEQDLKMAMPLAAQIMKVSMSDLKNYTDEVKSRMIEETDYELELNRSIELSEKCGHISNIIFPTYYPEYSGSKVITMDWIDGMHLQEWIETNPNQVDRNKIGQVLWDFYHYQIHSLQKIHADPHPGNFLITSDGDLAVLDFGCVKELPHDFYQLFVQLLDPSIFENREKLQQIFVELEFIYEDESDEEQAYFSSLIKEAISHLLLPFRYERFDFSDQEFMDKIYAMANDMMRDPKLRKGNAARGPRDAIYVNRTYFGLYSILAQLGAEVKTGY